MARLSVWRSLPVTGSSQSCPGQRTVGRPPQALRFGVPLAAPSPVLWTGLVGLRGLPGGPGLAGSRGGLPTQQRALERCSSLLCPAACFPALRSAPPRSSSSNKWNNLALAPACSSPLSSAEAGGAGGAEVLCCSLSRYWILRGEARSLLHPWGGYPKVYAKGAM